MAADGNEDVNSGSTRPPGASRKRPKPARERSISDAERGLRSQDSAFTTKGKTTYSSRLPLPNFKLDARGILNSRLTQNPFYPEKMLQLWDWDQRFRTVKDNPVPVGMLAIKREPDGTLMRITKSEILNVAIRKGVPMEKRTWLLAIAMQETETLSASYTRGDVAPAVFSYSDPKMDVRAISNRFGYVPFRLRRETNEMLFPKMEYFEKQPKTDDAANFGIYKMNWFMIKKCPTAKMLVQQVRIDPITRSVLNNEWEIEKVAGERINHSVVLATEILIEAMRQWSIDPPDPINRTENNFWAGHRLGETGLRNLPQGDWVDILRYYRSVEAIKIACDRDEKIWESNIKYYSDVPAI